MDLMKNLSQSIMKGNEQDTISLCKQLLERGYDPMDLLEKGMIPAMEQCGEMLTRRESFIPQILMSTRAMQAGVDVLRPQLVHEEKPHLKETIIIGTVLGDIHVIGKTLVSIMLQSVGFQVVDLGTNVSAEEFIAAIQKHEARIVTLSAMLTTAMNSMRTIVREIQEYDFGWKVHILIGGAPITPRYARELGVEYADNAIDSMSQALNIEGITNQD